MTNDTNVVIYSLAYHQRFCEHGIQELWIKFEIKDGCRNIPIHKLGQQLGGEKCSALLKAYILTGFDVTSKIGTKASAIASKPENISMILVLNLCEIPDWFVPKSIL